jgi:hypothetical protein
MDLSHPSLFAVAVREAPGTLPLPLRCRLYVLYPVVEPPYVTGFDIETYVGMDLPTVATAMGSWAEEHELRLEEAHFVMDGEQVTVSANLQPPQQTDWAIEPRGNSIFHYPQVSLTQYTDQDSYSHQLVYPRRERCFVEPMTAAAASAFQCRISVSNTIRELCYLLVIPSPRKEPLPLSPHHTTDSVPTNGHSPNPRPTNESTPGRTPRLYSFETEV